MAVNNNIRDSSLVMLAAIALVNDETSVAEFREAVVRYLDLNPDALEFWLERYHEMQRQFENAR